MLNYSMKPTLVTTIQKLHYPYLLELNTKLALADAIVHKLIFFSCFSEFYDLPCVVFFLLGVKRCYSENNCGLERKKKKL